MKRNAFTLVELLVVIFVVSLLAALLLPALNSALDTARRVACMTDRRENFLQTLEYTNDHDGALPNRVVGLAQGGYVADPTTLFCPAFVRHKRKWRPGLELDKFYPDRPAFLKEALDKQDLPWKWTSYFFGSKLNPWVWEEEIVGGGHGFWPGVRMCGVYFYDWDENGAIKVGPGNKPDAVFLHEQIITFDTIAEQWDNPQSTPYGNVTPLWLACADYGNNTFRGGHYHDEPGLGYSHQRRGLNNCVYDGSVRWVSWEERGGNRTGNGETYTAFTNNDSHNNVAHNPYWKWARKHATPKGPGR